MWIFLLLPLLFSLGDSSRFGRTHLRVASADAFKLQCESMNYRSFVEGNICYFAINSKITQDRGDLMCRNTYRGAKMYLERNRDRVLRRLMLNPSDYHDIISDGKMNVLCAYDSEFSCDDGDLTLPGRCVTRSNKPITWPEAVNFCYGKGASSAVIHNEYENSALTGLLSNNEAGWLLPSREQVWSAEDQRIDYWKWFFEEDQTPSNLKCSDDSQHAIVTSNAKSGRSAYGQWKVDYATNKNIALCVKDAACPLCPLPQKLPDTTTATPTTTTAPLCFPKNNPPRQSDIWDLFYYYNWGRVLHAFAATPEGYASIQSNGIGYNGNDGAGSMGGTLSDEGYDRLNETCSDPEERKQIVKMWFSKQGVAYQHIFEDSTLSKDVYVGYVALKQNACGSKWPVRRWGCLVSWDAMYAGNLNSNTWYSGRASGVHFWLWETNEAERNKQFTTGKECPTTTTGPNGPPPQRDLWSLNYYYHWTHVLHAFAATRDGYNRIQSNGIGGYHAWSSAGVLGGTISDEGYKRLPETCSNAEQRKHVVKMWFSKQGVAYQHVFENSTLSKDIYVGYVALEYNACGARRPMKRWSCSRSADNMYGGNLNGNAWYAGREQDGGKIHFWLWESNDSSLK